MCPPLESSWCLLWESTSHLDGPPHPDSPSSRFPETPLSSIPCTSLVTATGYRGSKIPPSNASISQHLHRVSQRFRRHGLFLSCVLLGQECCWDQQTGSATPIWWVEEGKGRGGSRDSLPWEGRDCLHPAWTVWPWGSDGGSRPRLTYIFQLSLSLVGFSVPHSLSGVLLPCDTV